MASNNWRGKIKPHKEYFFYALVVALLLFATYIIVSTCSTSKKAPEKIVLEDTPIIIDSVRPTGQLYVSSAVMEDYVTERRTESHLLGIYDEEHVCAQMATFKCSYVLNLDSVKYEQKDGTTVIATLPPLQAVYTLQNSPFTSDDPSYWAKELPSTNGLKEQVKKKVMSSFDTNENRRKSILYAQSALREMLKKLHYNVEFTSTIEQKPKN